MASQPSKRPFRPGPVPGASGSADPSAGGGNPAAASAAAAAATPAATTFGGGSSSSSSVPTGSPFGTPSAGGTLPSVNAVGSSPFASAGISISDGDFARALLPAKPKWGGAREGWEDFKFLLNNFLAALSPELYSLVKMAGEQPTEIPEVIPNDAKLTLVGFQLYAFIVSCLDPPKENRALVLLKEKQSRSGFEAWRRLTKEFEGRDLVRSTMWRSQLLQWNLMASGEDQYFTQFKAFLKQCDELSRQTGQELSDNDKLGVVLLHKPASLSQAMTLVPQVVKSWELMRNMVETHYEDVAKITATVPPDAMQVGFVSNKGSGKGGGTSSGSPGKGQSGSKEKKEKKDGKKKDGKGDKKDGKSSQKGAKGSGKGTPGGQKGSTANKQKTVKPTVQCFNCGENHYKRDCRQPMQVGNV